MRGISRRGCRFFSLGVPLVSKFHRGLIHSLLGGEGQAPGGGEFTGLLGILIRLEGGLVRSLFRDLLGLHKRTIRRLRSEF